MIETETAPNPALMDLPRYVSEIYIISLYVLNKSGDPMDCSAPGSSVHGVFQARVLEWGAIAFSTIGLESTFCFFPYLIIDSFIFIFSESGSSPP